MTSRPSWGTIVGIFMILFGGCGTINNLKLIQTENMMEMTNSVMENMEVEFEQEELDSTDLQILDMISDSIHRIAPIKNWT